MRYVLALIAVITFAIALTPRIAGAVEFVTIARRADGHICYFDVVKSTDGSNDAKKEVQSGMEFLSTSQTYSFRGIANKASLSAQEIYRCTAAP
jgi:hypothetical protein